MTDPPRPDQIWQRENPIPHIKVHEEHPSGPLPEVPPPPPDSRFFTESPVYPGTIEDDVEAIRRRMGWVVGVLTFMAFVETIDEIIKGVKVLLP